MSQAEIRHRVIRATQLHAERLGLSGSVVAPPADTGFVPAPWVGVPRDLDNALYVKAADRILAGRFDIFSLHDIELGSPPTWNRDPKTGVEASLEFGKLLDYRVPERVGDIKYLWEPNRHLHIVTLAQAYALTKDERYSHEIKRHLESWFDACPFGKGANWSSSLEAGIRLINWAIAWQLLGGNAGPSLLNDGVFRHRWLASIYQHAQFIRGHLSLFSSANNHLIGEVTGLFIAAVTWPHWPCATQWRKESQAILERECLLQNACDGVNREQAISYQQFELDLLLLALLAGRSAGVEFSPSYTGRIEAMLEFLASIMDVKGNVPMIGDSDDGLVVNLAQNFDFCRYRSVLATGAVLFRRAEFKAKTPEFDDKSQWLLGAEGLRTFEALPASPSMLPVRCSFPEGGYYILGCDFETPNEIRMVADAGPLGYQSIAAHGHADALSFTLSVGGAEFLIDPGTFAYHTQPEWREYFRGTAAHNTLRIDGENQSVTGGNFMWLKKANAACTMWKSTDSADDFEGWHDGYSRLAGKVGHRRRITLDKHSRCIRIEDSLEMDRDHGVELFFHCAEGCSVFQVKDGFGLQRENRVIYLKLPAEGTASVYHGSTEPIAGWVSRRFDSKMPITTIVWRASCSRAISLVSEIQC